MQTMSVAPDVWQDIQASDTLVPAPRQWIARLLASLRASVALVNGRYPRGERQSRPGRDPSEMDPVARLAQIMILPPFC
jgi:hypothetical protein